MNQEHKDTCEAVGAPTKVATFVRVSLSANESAQVSMQEKSVLDYCMKHGYEIDSSAIARGDRKVGANMLMMLLKTARENNIGKIVMASANRIAGTPEELVEIQKLCREYGVEIETIDGSIPFEADSLKMLLWDTSDPCDDSDKGFDSMTMA